MTFGSDPTASVWAMLLGTPTLLWSLLTAGRGAVTSGSGADGNSSNSNLLVVAAKKASSTGLSCTNRPLLVCWSGSAGTQSLASHTCSVDFVNASFSAITQSWRCTSSVR